jgi:outer membrane protein assembly factor BamB
MGYDSTSSVADTDGNLLTTSADGFLYDFALGASNGSAPTTSVDSPAVGSVVRNPGGTVTISGTAAGTPIAAVDVAIQEDGPDGPWWNGSKGAFTPGYFNNPATVASPGAATTDWSLNLPVPNSGGSYAVQSFAIGSDGIADTSGDSAVNGPSRDAFSVGYLSSAPHLAVTSGSAVAPGGTLTVSGSGFGDDESVTLTLGGAVLGTETSTATGKLPAKSVTVPATAAFGETALVATGAISGQSSSVTVDVSNQWPGESYDSEHTAYEPNDNVMSDHQSADNPRFLIPAWSYSTGSAISTAPAVVDNVAYVGDASGTVTALDVRNSVPLWTAAAGSAVTGSPLVANGLVIVGTAAGDVEAFDAATGTQVWSYTAGSAVDAAPTYAGGDNIVVADSTGQVTELDTSTGDPVWSVALAGGVVGSPAVDVSKALVAISAGSDVYALSQSTGAVEWSATTGGAVSAAPSIANSEILVGSSDGTVYAWNESTGATEWTYAAGASITAGGAVINGAYVVGTSAGAVDYVKLVSGALVKSFSAGSPVVGLAAANFFLVVTTSSGTTHGFKYVGETAWTYRSTMGSAAPAAVVDGVVYLTGLDTTISAFTVPGRPIP